MLIKTASLIAKHPKTVAIVALLLLIPCVWGYMRTGVNYDLLSYLPAELNSVQGEEVLDQTFGVAASSILILEDLSPKDMQALKAQIRTAPGVKDVIWSDSIIDLGFPTAYLPEAVKSILYSADGSATLMLIRHDGTAASEDTMESIAAIRKLLNAKSYLSGMSAMLADMKSSILPQVPIYMAVAVALALAVMLLAMDSWLTPFLLLLALSAAVLYNMGTNLFLGEISFLTQSVSAILQLAVTIDYSIILLDRYKEELGYSTDRREAMAKAIATTFTALAGSSLTTLFGFLALCFMQLTLGFDIGFVMAKGVALGVLTVVTVLPALILLFGKHLERYSHKPCLPHFDKLNTFLLKRRKVLTVVFFILFIPAYILQANTEKYYSMDRMLPADFPSVVGLSKLKTDFHMATTHFIIVDDALPPATLAALAKDIQEVEGITSVLSLYSFAGPAFPQSMIPEPLQGITQKEGKQLMLVNSSYASATEEVNTQIKTLQELVYSADPGGMVTGEGVLYKDLIETADTDFQVTAFISIAAIFVLISILFQSLTLPVLLVGIIELAIFINLAISRLTGSEIPFIAPTVISCIQLGATVDYAILLTTRYREELRHNLKADDAVRKAANASCRSIMQSCMVFFVATVGVYVISDIPIIQSLCVLLARGAIVSGIVIIGLLAPLLRFFDPLIRKTTRNWDTRGKRHEARSKKAEGMHHGV
ncbi:MAG: MMPL family transporter [Oscillospiraceae bacterium]|nr:MMPL family transporter [Oscillospiraceae bacterium]